MFLYKIQILQDQTGANKAERLAFCQSISRQIEDYPNFLDLIFSSGEAHFHLSGQVKQNMQFWAQAQPHEHVLRLLSVEKVTVLCAIGCNGIIRPYWFEDDNGRPVTVNIERYVEMIQRKFIPALRRKHGIDMNTVIYQQDGATLDTSNVSLEYLRRYFSGDRLILHRTDNPWPAHSPDLSPPDFFLWGYLKERVYYNNLQTKDALKENIRREIRIPGEMFDRVINNFNVRVATVIQRQGAWIEHVINY